MYDSIGISQKVNSSETRRWLLLIHQIPPKPDYFRVKVRRRLQRIGAVALKNSVYVLPETDEATEDFQWLRRAIADEGGEATLCTASLVDGITDWELESMFRAQSDAEYAEIAEVARVAEEDPSAADLRRLRRQLAEADNRDFFRAAGADAAHQSVQETAAALERERRLEAASRKRPSETTPRGATWVTRKGLYVDRIASAWLIRRFIDPDARFKFVPAKGYEPERGELRFDMYEGEFTHQGDRCTFEVLVEEFTLGDAALRAIAEIVHDIDLKDDKFGRDEATGVVSMLSGIVFANSEDAARVDAGAGLLDGLYAAFARRSG